MTISVSATVLLTVVVIWLVRKGGLKAWHAVVTVLAGFYLAGSSLAPTISEATRNMADLISRIRL